ncbi:MAG: alpha/beta fold hydrolase [Acidimicrobiales bacterium]
MSTWTAPDGVGLVYDIEGEGPPVLLLHGFASDARTNWIRPGVAGALVDAGFTVVTYDARGHGRSDKPHDPAAYSGGAMGRDASGLIGHLGFESVDLVGYSLGAQVTAALLPEERRARRAVLGGIGSRLLLRVPGEARYPALAIAAALEADDPETIADATGRAFRAFADATKADRAALAALQRGRDVGGLARLGDIGVPVLFVAGDRDTLIGDPAAAVAAVPGARLEVVPGDHLSAVVSPAFATAVVRFLAA